MEALGSFPVTSVLVACSNQVGASMAGPAIRAWEMARLLQEAGHDVALLASSVSQPPTASFRVDPANKQTVAAAVNRADIVIAQGPITSHYPDLLWSSRHLVVDLYDPYPLETLEAFAGSAPSEREAQHWPALATLVLQLRCGDLFLCSHERQRDLWLGALLLCGRVNPNTHAQDHLLNKLLEVAPFGIPRREPRPGARPLMRGVWPSFDGDAKIALWAGGIYNWFDPLSLIRAWPAVMEAVPSARLAFLGLRHPNPTGPEMSMARAALRLAEDLGLRDRGVVFNPEWVPYEAREAYLLEADVGVSTHFEHLETRYSFRTRYLDYIWAGLPMVTSEGDPFAAWIRDHGAGSVVAPEDPAAIAAALGALLADDASRRDAAARIRAARPELWWEAALAPLLRYCESPWGAADLAFDEGRRVGYDSSKLHPTDPAGLAQPRGMARRLAWYLHREGPAALAARSLRKLRRIAGARI